MSPRFSASLSRSLSFVVGALVVFTDVVGVSFLICLCLLRMLVTSKAYIDDEDEEEEEDDDDGDDHAAEGGRL